MSESRRRRLKGLTFAYASTLLLLVIAADRGALTTTWISHVPAGDKIGHFLLMGLLAYLVNTAMGGARWQWRRFSVLKGSALVATLILVEELSQLGLAHRAFELADLAADAAGVWCFSELSERQQRAQR